MPTEMLRKWAKDADKSLAEAEKAWDECKEQATKKFGKDAEKKNSSRYWSYVNLCSRSKLGLIKHNQESISVLKKWT